MIDLEERLRDAAPRPTRGLDVNALANAAAQRTRRHRMAIGAVVAGVVLVLIAGIALVQQRSESESLDVVGVPDPLEGVAEDSWLRLMARLPRQVAVSQGSFGAKDLARARRAMGIEPLPHGADDLVVDAHLAQLLKGMNTTVFGSQPLASSQLRAELGFGLEDIDQMVEGGVPPSEFYIATGRFDPAAIDSAGRSDPTWGPRLEIKEHRGFTFYSWGEDYRTSADFTPVRSLGRGGRLVVGDGWISWTFGDAEARATIDAALDTRTSAATIDLVRTAAEQADAADLSFFALVPMEPVRSPAANPQLPAMNQPITLIYGHAAGSDSQITQVSLVYADAEQATANREPLVASVDRLFGPASVEVTQNDRLLTLEFYVSDPSIDGFRFLSQLNYRPSDIANPERPRLPDPRPTQAEALADGKVSDEEYELAFWTYVECAEDADVDFASITRDEDGQFRYSVRTNLSAADACYNEHFFDVDRVWQVAN